MPYGITNFQLFNRRTRRLRSLIVFGLGLAIVVLGIGAVLGAGDKDIRIFGVFVRTGLHCCLCRFR